VRHHVWCMTVLLGLSTCALSGAEGGSSPATSAPRDAITMRLVPEETRAAIGDSLVLQLEFTNVSASPVRVWMSPADFPGWSIELLLHSPGEGRHVIVPMMTTEGTYFPQAFDMVALAPGERCHALLVLRGGEHLQGRTGTPLYDWWECYRPEDWAHRLTNNAMNVDSCMSGPGIYTLRAELDLAYSGIDLDHPKDSTLLGSGPPIFTGRLKTPSVRIVLTSRR